MDSQEKDLATGKIEEVNTENVSTEEVKNQEALICLLPQYLHLWYLLRSYPNKYQNDTRNNHEHTAYSFLQVPIDYTKLFAIFLWHCFLENKQHSL